MDILRSITINVIDKVIGALKFMEYNFYLLLGPYVESEMISTLRKWGIEVNGKEPWDIQVHNKKFFARVAAYGTLGLGQTYMEKWWDCDQLDVMLTKILRNGAFYHFYSRYNAFLLNLRWNWLNMQTRAKVTEVRDQHYDLGRDLFEIFLDPSMTYSCAYWKTAKDEKQAQLDKFELIAQKLELKPGMKVLDIGMGYGGIEKYLIENYGVSMVGITISKEMGAVASERCKGLDLQVIVGDYREIAGKYDRIICIEMIEHVGGHNHRSFFELVRRCLKDDGVFLLQTNGINDKKVPVNDAFFNSILFNNLYIPRLEEIVDAANELFIMEDLHNLGADYDTSLMAGARNFEENWHKVSHKYGPNFYRMWRYYLLFSAGVTRSRICQLWQIVFSKQGIVGGLRCAR